MAALVKCLQCKVEFLRDRNRSPKAKFCSQTCYMDCKKAKSSVAVIYPSRACEVCGIQKKASEFAFNGRAYSEGIPYRMRTCKKCWRARYRASIAETRKKYEHGVRRTVIEGLGGKCRCCGQSLYEFLSIHHAGGRGSGRDHRKKFKKQLSLLRDIVRRGFPMDEFEVLCWDCHMSITFHGYCPHRNILPVGVKEA